MSNGILKAILQILLGNPNCDDMSALSGAGGGRTDDVRWRRHVRWRRRWIYAVIRLRDENATTWEIPPDALEEKVTQESITLIMAVTWASMKHFDDDDETAMRKAGLLEFDRRTVDGYASMIRTIWQRIRKLDSETLADWRVRLEEQMERSVGGRSRNWIAKLDEQIAALHDLSR